MRGRTQLRQARSPLPGLYDIEESDESGDNMELEFSEPLTDGSESLESLKDFIASESGDSDPGLDVNSDCESVVSSSESQGVSISTSGYTRYKAIGSLAQVFAALEKIQEALESLKDAMESVKYSKMEQVESGLMDISL